MESSKFIDFTERTETYGNRSMSKIHESRCTSRWHFVQVNLLSVTPILQNFEDRSQEETEWQERLSREAAWRLAKIVLKSKEKKQATFFSLSENRCLSASNLKPEERELLLTPERRCTWSAKRTWIPLNWETVTKMVQSYDSHNRQWRSTDVWRGDSVRQNWKYSWPWKFSRIRQQSYRSESFAMKTDILTSGWTVKTTSH